jgi:plasmid stabilization system protein ParE
VPIRAIAFHDGAAADYDTAFEWYMERSANAAIRFDEEVERALTDIARTPQRWPAGSHGTRRFLLRGFPYLLINHERSAATIRILAVAHTSRRPGYWKERIE